MLGVGNDSATTAQYGGTAVAGDVGTLADDDYGIKTSIGTGHRIATVGKMLARAEGQVVKDKVRVDVWLLQDTDDHRGRKMMERFAREIEDRVAEINIRINDYSNEEIHRCIACDLCPTSMAPTEVYRCIINAKTDLFKRRHRELLENDAILIAAYSPSDRSRFHSNYQRFIERTRYLRRDDYALGDRLVAPMVISEINSRQNLHVRTLTSFVRHHTVLHHPVIGMEYQGQILNWETMLEQGESFARNAIRLTAGRLMTAKDRAGGSPYNPVGYVISAEKHRQNVAAGVAGNMEKLRMEHDVAAKNKRLG